MIDPWYFFTLSEKAEFDMLSEDFSECFDDLGMSGMFISPPILYNFIFWVYFEFHITEQSYEHRVSIDFFFQIVCIAAIQLMLCVLQFWV